MPDFFDVVHVRRSYRLSFEDAPVAPDDLRAILEAGLAAPSGKNQQTTSFVVVDDPDLLAKIRPLFPAKAMQQAPVLIACLIDADPAPVFHEYSFQLEDCAAAVENMLLAVTALGYASVWVDGALRLEGRAEKIAGWLGVPAGKVVQVILPVGRPAEGVTAPEKKPLEARVFFNQYGKDRT